MKTIKRMGLMGLMGIMSVMVLIGWLMIVGALLYWLRLLLGVPIRIALTIMLIASLALQTHAQPVTNGPAPASVLAITGTPTITDNGDGTTTIVVPTANGPVTNVVQTPSSTTIGQDLLSGINKLITSTNMFWETHATYASGLTKKWGAGFGGFYQLTTTGSAGAVNFNTYGGLRFDGVDGDFWMPEGNVGMEAPIRPISAWSSFVITPFTYAGIGVPLSGAKIGGVTIGGNPPRDNNGQATAILGAGAALKFFDLSSKWDLGGLADAEIWTGFSGKQYRFGLWLKRKI